MKGFRVLKRIRFNFKVSSSNKLANTKASSSFEAATKFGFVLRLVGLASNTTPDCLSLKTTSKCHVRQELVVSNVVLGMSSKPHMSLYKIENIAKDNSKTTNINILSTRQAAYYHEAYDASWSEHLIKSTLYSFVIISLKPLQKKIILAIMNSKKCSWSSDGGKV